MVVTEVAIIPLKGGLNINDASSPAGKTWLQICETTSLQPGFRRMLWGTEVHQANMLRLFVEWDKIEDHERFVASGIYKAHISRFDTITGGPTTVFHVNLTPNCVSAFPHGAGVATEVFTQYFPADYSESYMSLVEDTIKSIASLFEATPGSGARMSTSGWILEDVVIPAEAAEAGRKAKAFLASMAWDSVEAHLAFQKTETFKACIPRFQDIKGLKHSDLVYVYCKTA
ncbi:hypothetical protein CLAIMM_08395 [Cladophialophora immunda]|nr:hypothetical protein CLAIMM_08395 [Cladophialophora immunda]